MADAQPKLPDIPGKIGMAMSGGGYRATAFHLGSLSYLDRVGLRSGLQMISTVSGGTFTGCSYALALVDGKEFGTYFRELYGQLDSADLVAGWMQKLGDAGGSRVASRRRDVIVSAAQVYADTFFANSNGPRRFGEILDADIPLVEAVFNATEFRNGIALRFQRSRSGIIGNGKIRIPREQAAKLRVADIVAASSCFPGGFEPLSFPDDFHWPDETVPEPVAKLFKEIGPIAVMDGGIYDNQGIESLLRADGRSGDELDAFIISDVGQLSDDSYAIPKSGKPSVVNRLSLGTVSLIARLMTAVCALTALVSAWAMWQELARQELSFLALFLHFIPMVLAAGTAWALWWFRATARHEFNKIPQIGRAAWKDLKRLTIGQARTMVELRIGSLFAMASSIFMARIRTLDFGLLFADSKYEGRRVSNLIYHLQSGQPFAFAKNKLVAEPTKQLRAVVDVAATMPTTLWFDHKYELPCLVATGQVTLCYNLLKFIARRHGDDPSTYPPAVGQLWSRLVSDWNAMNTEPYVLLREGLNERQLACPP